MTNATDNNAAASNVNPLASIISAAMRDASSSDNRQAALTIGMYKSELTYSSDNLLALLKLTGSDKTDAINDDLSDISGEFAMALRQVKQLRDVDGKRTAQEKLIIDGLDRKIRAARVMYERAAKSVYWLRAQEFTKVMVNATSAGAFKAMAKDDDGDPEAHYLSCNRLASLGEALVKEKTGKAVEPARAKKRSIAESLADSSKGLAAVMSGVLSSEDKQRFDMIEDNTEIASNLASVFETYVKLQCGDEKGVIDLETLAELLSKVIGHDVRVTEVKARKSA